MMAIRFALMVLALAGQALIARAAEPSPELKALQETAQNYYRAGSYAEALDVAERALALTHKEFGPDSEQAAVQEYGAGFTAERAGRLDVAERHYRASVRIAERVYGADSPAVTQAQAELGNVLLKQGKTDEAEPLLKRVLALRSAVVGRDHSYTGPAHAGLGALALARRDYEGALTSYRQAVRVLTQQEGTQPVVKDLVEQQIRQNRDAFVGLASAAWGLRAGGGGDATALMEETYAAGQLAWATSAASALARMTARLKAGETELGRSIRAHQDLNDTILALNAQDMQALADWSRVQRSDPEYSRVLEQFRAVSIAQGRINAPIIQKQKAAVEQLQDLMKRCPPGQKGGAGCENSDRDRTAIARELGALSAEAAKGSQDLAALSARLQAAEAKLPGAAAFAAARKARLGEQQRLETQLAAARTEIVRRFPNFIDLSEPKPLTVEATRALLGSNEALIAILAGSARSFIWVVTRERTDWAEIPAGSAELAADVEILRQGLDPDANDGTAPSTGSTTIVGGFDLGRAHALYRKLLGPIEPLIANKDHIVLVPTGPLTSLPFQVLLAEPPRSDVTGAAALRSAPWLIRRHALSVLPSVQSLASLRRLAASGRGSQPFLGVGDPILLGPSAEERQRGKGRKPRIASLYRSGGQVDVRAVRQLVPLPETADELQAIGKVLGAPPEAILLREAATKSRFKSLRLSEYRIIQFATHGLVAGNLEDLTEPALVLTPLDTASGEDDGLLTASEIANLKLDADWVVLSACNTAAGDAVGADALSGLARAFFFSGARALLVSHWSVGSAAAVRLTTGAFSAMAESPGLGRAEAMRRSMLAMIDKGTMNYSHPMLWAPFVVVGEGGGQR